MNVGYISDVKRMLSARVLSPSLYMDSELLCTCASSTWRLLWGAKSKRCVWAHTFQNVSCRIVLPPCQHSIPAGHVAHG